MLVLYVYYVPTVCILHTISIMLYYVLSLGERDGGGGLYDEEETTEDEEKGEEGTREAGLMEVTTQYRNLVYNVIIIDSYVNDNFKCEQRLVIYCI